MTPDPTSPKTFDPVELMKLAERCEQASGPSRELDGEVWRATGELPEHYRWQEVGGVWCQIGPHGVSDLDVAEPFTASLDAAMTLIPNGWEWLIRWFGYVEVWDRELRNGVRLRRQTGQAATTALAFTAACLRALASRLEVLLAEQGEG